MKTSDKQPSKDIPKRIRKQWNSLTDGQKWFWTQPKSEREAWKRAKKEEEQLDEFLRSIK